MMPAATCAACRFFAEKEGQCRRRAPTGHVVVVPSRNLAGAVSADVQVLGVFPGVKPDHWCGEYEAADKESTT